MTKVHRLAKSVSVAPVELVPQTLWREKESTRATKEVTMSFSKWVFVLASVIGLVAGGSLALANGVGSAASGGHGDVRKP